MLLCIVIATLLPLYLLPNWLIRSKPRQTFKSMRETSLNLKCIQNGQLRATFMNTAPSSSALRETHTCSQILNEQPWVIGIVFSFKKVLSKHHRLSFQLLRGPLIWRDFLPFGKQRNSGRTQFPISIKHSYSR